MINCAVCERQEMEKIDTYKEYESILEYTVYHVYQCGNCNKLFHKPKETVKV